MDEMLSRLFLRPMPAAKGLAMIPGDIWGGGEALSGLAWPGGGEPFPGKGRGEGANLKGSHGFGVKALANEHQQPVPHGPQDLDRLRVGHAQQALLVHLQDAQAHPQPAIAGRCPGGADLKGTKEVGRWRHGCPPPGPLLGYPQTTLAPMGEGEGCCSGPGGCSLTLDALGLLRQEQARRTALCCMG